MARLTTSSALDTSFNGDGKQTVDFGGTQDLGYGVAVDSQDNVLVAGYSNQGSPTGYDFAVARLTPSGALDTSFDGDGKQTVDFGGTQDLGYGVAVDSQDNVLVAGYSDQGGATGYDFAVARLTTSGPGYLVQWRWYANDPLWQHERRRLGRGGGQPGQRAGGRLFGSGGRDGLRFRGGSADYFGALDTSFDSDGKQTVDFGSTNDFAYDVALDSQGRVLVAGNSPSRSRAMVRTMRCSNSRLVTSSNLSRRPTSRHRSMPMVTTSTRSSFKPTMGTA